jgi:hypothetical protein
MMKKMLFGFLVIAIVLVISNGCAKDNTNYDFLYTPTAIDTTANASLAQLQQGRKLFINNCGNCHSVPSPDSYTVVNWKSILSNMVPKTSLSKADAALVSKYVTRGKQ